ncbi:ABC transporter permease [Sporosarcina saromensis]|uniref:ABC transporter permease n=1 Tax=Sporosarcina saromensis TaxID=359365 RepID=A0ABU4GFA4_9BACL|nr:ABC transporter permease [Sporosarcina saromensis]MDW0114998.1 ABC transporter permease [Sporosarcina saromensis]
MSRFILRRDRVRLFVWLFSISALTWLTAISFTGLYQTEQERQAIAETMKNPAMSAMIGKGYGLDAYTTGAMLAHQMLLFTAVAVAIMSILFVNRHTRAEEEDGRFELLRALPVGGLTNIGATLLLNATFNVLLAIVTAIGLLALQIESIDLVGSMLYGAALVVTGIFFGVVTALFAQLSESARGTIGLSFSILGLAYLLRAVGDAGNAILSWFSPLGWVLAAEVFVNNYWWPIVLTLAGALVIACIAFYLHALRDLGAGYIRARRGRKSASVFLQTSFGLAFRLQRTALYSWAIGMFVLGLSYGSVLGDLESFFLENEMLAQMLQPVEGFSLLEQFIPMLMSVIAMIGTIPVLMVMLKVRREEKKGRLDAILSRSVSRIRLLSEYVLLSFLTSIVMLGVGALGLWSASSAVLTENLSIGLLLKAAYVNVPAILVMIGMVVLLIGLLPSRSNAIWVYLIYSFIVVYMGGLLQFPDWLGKLSPFGYVPKVPIEQVNGTIASLVVLLGIVLIAFGMKMFSKRDVQ